VGAVLWKFGLRVWARKFIDVLSMVRALPVRVAAKRVNHTLVS